MKSTTPQRSRVWLAFGLAGWLGVAAAVLACLRWMAGEVFEGDTNAFDAAVRAAIHGIASEPLTKFLIAMSFIGSPLVVSIGTVVSLAVLVYFRLRRQAILLAVVMAGEVFLDVILKNAYERVRPEPYFDYTLPTSFSFPSGHALGSICFYGCLALLLSTLFAKTSYRVAIWLAAVAIILLVGLSRVYLGVHYPTDVIAGYIAGSVWIAAVWISFGRLFPDQIKKHGPE